MLWNGAEMPPILYQIQKSAVTYYSLGIARSYYTCSQQHLQRRRTNNNINKAHMVVLPVITTLKKKQNKTLLHSTHW